MNQFLKGSKCKWSEDRGANNAELYQGFVCRQLVGKLKYVVKSRGLKDN